MSETDVRWKHRFGNFNTALTQLQLATQETQHRALSDLEKQGLIQTFEFTHELAWNVMRDYFLYQGQSQITGSRDATRESFQKGLISDGERWMEMIKSRNQSSHTYNKSTAEEIVDRILNQYFASFCAFQKQMQALAQK